MRHFRDHFGLIVDSVVAVMMGFFMGVATMLLHHETINWASLLDSWSTITLIVIFVNVLMPINVWGAKTARMAGIREESAGFTLFANLLPTAIINTVLGAVLPAMSIFYNEAVPASERAGQWLAAFISDWPPTYVIAFFMSLLSAWTGKKIAHRVLG